MKHLWAYIVFIFLFFGFEAVASGDSIKTSLPKNIETKDSIESLPKEYQSLKKHSSKNKWTKRLFSLLFKEAKPPKENKNDSLSAVYKHFEGKIIRKINIKVLSPFGTDIERPDYYPKDYNFLNKAHVSTRASTVRNIIQFRRGTPFNSAIIATSEAELRNARFINDARISADSVEHSSDSVDVNIIVKDKWTIGVELHSLTTSKINLEIFDKNILGSGSRAGLNFIYANSYDRKFGYGMNYLYRNVAKTNIDLEGSYIDKIKDSELSLSAERKLQPKLKYFGELSYSKKKIQPDLISWDSISPDSRENISLTVGRAFTLSEKNTIRRFVIGFRYKRKLPEYKNEIYQSHIKEKLLPYKYLKNDMFLVKLSLYQNSYEREYMIYNFGNTEDIARGYNISLQLGYSKFKKIRDGYYGSLSASYGSNSLFGGYLYLSGAASSFFNSKDFFGGVLKLDTRYFSPLFQISDLNFRQFITFNYSKLIHPDRYFGDMLYMGDQTTLRLKNWKRGCSGSGSEMLLIKSETDMFLNYEIAGFRILYYNFLDAGWVNESGHLFNNDNFNIGFGAGIRLRNNFIIFNTIDLKIGYYPRLNQSGFNRFFQVRSSTPSIPPNFVPTIPEEIILEK